MDQADPIILYLPCSQHQCRATGHRVVQDGSRRRRKTVLNDTEERLAYDELDMGRCQRCRLLHDQDLY